MYLTTSKRKRGMAEKVEPSESLMPKIRALLEPPDADEGQSKGKKCGERDADAVPWKSNHDHCDFCSEGGDLLCCDRCPCAFHLACCEPPVDPDDIPSGDWLCAKCRPAPAYSPDVIAPFDALVKQCLRRNPTSFSLPPEYSFNTPLPGGRKRRKAGEDSRSKSGSTASSLAALASGLSGNKQSMSSPSPLDNDPDYCEGDRTVRDFCFTCSKTKRAGCMVFCDFCPLAFHLDCLDPPLTNLPNTLWMCPNHAEHRMPSFRYPQLSERCAAKESASKMLDQKTVVLDFLNAAKKGGTGEQSSLSSDVTLPKRHAIEVPSAVKALYRQPLASNEHCTLSQLCKVAAEAKSLVGKARKSDPASGRAVGGSSSAGDDKSPPWWDVEQADVREQDEWLDSVVKLQYDATRYFSLPPSMKRKLSQQAASMSNIGKVKSAQDPALLRQGLQALQSQTGGLPEEDACGLSGIAFAFNTASTCAESASASVSPSSCVGDGSHGSQCMTTLEDTEHRHDVCSASGISASASLRSSRTSSVGVAAVEEDSSVSMDTWPRRARRGQKEDCVVQLLDDSDDEESGRGSPAKLGDALQRQRALHNDHLDYALPDVEHLDPRLVKLLATQRLQQIVSAKDKPSSSGCQFNTVANESSSSAHARQNSAIAAALTGSSVSANTATVTPSKENPSVPEPDLTARFITRAELLSAKALLCPLSGIGPPFPVNHHSVDIGLGLDMDLCLRFYSPCLRLSSMHASLFFDEGQQQFELLSYSECGVQVDGILYGCDLSHPLPSPGPSPLSVDHVRSSTGRGPRARRALQRVESARRRWRQPHSMRYLQDLLSYCVEGEESEDECSVSVIKDAEVNRNSDSDDEVDGLTCLPATARLNISSSMEVEVPSPNTLLQPNLPARPPRSPSPASACLTPTDGSSSWIHKQDAALRSAGFWLPSEAEKSLLCCSCSVENSAGPVTSGCLPGNWEGSAVLHHGSKVQFGCVHFVLSVAGKPGHDQLVKSLVSVAPVKASSHSSSLSCASNLRSSSMSSEPSCGPAVSASNAMPAS